jgi:hypothetical protein
MIDTILQQPYSGSTPCRLLIDVMRQCLLNHNFK